MCLSGAIPPRVSAHFANGAPSRPKSGKKKLPTQEPSCCSMHNAGPSSWVHGHKFSQGTDWPLFVHTHTWTHTHTYIDVIRRPVGAASQHRLDTWLSLDAWDGGELSAWERRPRRNSGAGQNLGNDLRLSRGAWIVKAPPRQRCTRVCASFFVSPGHHVIPGKMMHASDANDVRCVTPCVVTTFHLSCNSNY